MKIESKFDISDIIFWKRDNCTIYRNKITAIVIEQLKGSPVVCYRTEDMSGAVRESEAFADPNEINFDK